MTSSRVIGVGAFGPEPAHDPELAALLRSDVGSVPMDEVDWDALAGRISAGVAQQAAGPWWSYATRWERRMLPIALAAGLIGALALITTSPASATTVSSLTTASAAATAVVTGTPVEDAASQFARSITSVADIAAVTP